MTEIEKSEFSTIARKIIYLDVKHRGEGLLALEEDLDEISGFGEKNTLLLKKLLSLAIDGRDASVIRQVCERYISVDAKSSFEKTCFNAILDGVLSVYETENPRILAEKLGAYTGILNSIELVPELQSYAEEVKEQRKRTGKWDDGRCFYAIKEVDGDIEFEKIDIIKRMEEIV